MTLTPTPTPITRERSPDNPSQWNAPYTFQAYLETIRVQARLTFNNSIAIWLTPREALLLDAPQAISITGLEACLNWVRVHVAAGPDKEWLVNYYTQLSEVAWYALVRRLGLAEAERIESQAAAEAEWRKSPEYQRLQFKMLELELMKIA